MSIALKQAAQQALDALVKSKNALEVLWVSHHANRTDYAIEDIDSAMEALRTAIQQAEAKTDEPDDVVKDAERYRWLRSRMCGADFDWNESGIYGLVFELPDDAKVSANCDKTIDAAMTAAAQAQKGQP